MKDERSWIPGETDLDWIESIAADLPSALVAIETAAQPLGIPIVDRDAGRVLSVLAGGKRRIVEVGTAYGFSTLWLALGQPADGTIVTIDPDTERTDLARGWWRQAGIPDERITVALGQGTRGVRQWRSRPRRPVRSGVHRCTQAGVRRLSRCADGRSPGAGRARPRRQRPVERPRVGRHGGRRRGPEYGGAAGVQSARPRRLAVHLDDPARR